MDYLKRNLAPITEAAWQEIDEVAKEIITNNLSARKFVDVTGPLGWDASSISFGDLDIPNGQSKDDVRFGIRKVKPLIETRISFDLSIWELDDISRGSKTPDLDRLEEAAEKIAVFEENAIFKGFKTGDIEGFLTSAVNSVDLKADGDGYLDAVSKAHAILKKNAVEGPYTLVVNPEQWSDVGKCSCNGLMMGHIKQLIDGDVVMSKAVDNPILVSTRGGDFELTIGQDFSIGYEGHDSGNVKLFITETFAFNIYEPKAFVKLNVM